jgi:predicted alpha/beta hydrolase family esterase
LVSLVKKELELKGYDVIIPSFPTPENQSLTSWLNVFQLYREKLTEDSIIVGHSLGVPFAWHIIQQLNFQINKLICIAGSDSLSGNSDFDTINKTFLSNSFDWNSISDHCDEIIIFHGDNDPYIPLPIAKKYASHLKTKVNVVKNAGHFNEVSGYTSFPELLSYF